MSKSITFQGHTYVEAPFLGMPQGSVSVPALMGPELLDLYNLVAANLGRGRVKRFADNKSGAKRTWAILQDYDARPDDDFAMSAPLVAEVGNGSKVVQDTSAPNSFKVQLSDADRAQVTSEATARKPAPQSEALLNLAAQAGAKAQAQAKLRNAPPTSDNPAKDAEMPALRKAVKVMALDPKKTVYPRKSGSKQALLVDLLSRPEGATFGELYDGLAATGKPWKGVTIRSGLAWDINHIAGYGVTSELLNGEQFAAIGRDYEARRLGMRIQGPIADASWEPGDGYDPELRLAVYRLAYPKGMEAPLPHTGKKA
jgi:hypothetical protein